MTHRVLFFNSPLSTPPHTVRRHRGPVQKERDRQRAAHHQATKTGQQPATTALEEASTKFLKTFSKPVPDFNAVVFRILPWERLAWKY